MPEEKKATLLVIVPGSRVYADSLFTLVVAETGEVLASHGCSESGYAKGDLYNNRPERIEEYKNRFGEVEIKFIDETDISEKVLFKRNIIFNLKASVPNAFKEFDSKEYSKESTDFADSVCSSSEEPDKWQRAVAFYHAWFYSILSHIEY